MFLPDLDLDLARQAGGGGSFGSGGGSSGGGGGGGDGLGGLLYLLIRLAIEYPPLGVPLLITVVVVFYTGTRKGWWKHQERTIRRSRARRLSYASSVSADSLRASDPAFDETRFLARVKTAFEKAQNSWCAQDLEPLRPFVSDGVYERFSLQIEEQKEDGWRQGMDLRSSGPYTIVHVEPGAHFDTVTVRIPFRADIFRERLETGERIKGSRIPRDFYTECWSFVRRRGAKSIDGEGLIEGKCPNCGAPIEINQSAKCTHCECLARSGEFDWVLTEITQMSEWRAEHEHDIPGLGEYLQHDPGLSVQLLEDRASVAFWRKCAADRLGGVDPLTRVASEELLANLTLDKHPMADCAVGSVRTLGLLEGLERDRALVEVVWDGRPGVDIRRVIRRTLFVFGRAAGQRTRVEFSLTTAHCQTCGAHDLGGTEPACPYCGSPRTGDASTWLVDEILERWTPDARKLLDELVPPRNGAAPTLGDESVAGLLTWAAELVRVDGSVDQRELAGMRSLAERAELTPERVEALATANGGIAPAPRDAQEGRAWLSHLTELALADGGLDRNERRFLRDAAGRLDIDRRELERAIRTTRSRLYRESRDVKRFKAG